MVELLRTNDPGLLAVVGGLLREAEIPHHVADRDMSVMEGSTFFIQQRVLVAADREADARLLMVEAGLGEWLRR